MHTALAPLAIGVLVWFGLAFGTRTWLRQWFAALVAGLAVAWWRFDTMREVANTAGIEPMSFVRFAGTSVAGMLILSSVGMLLFWLLQKSRRAR